MTKKSSLTDVMVALRATPAPAAIEPTDEESENTQQGVGRTTPLQFVRNAPPPEEPLVAPLPSIHAPVEIKRQVSFRVPKSLSEQWTVAMSATSESGTVLVEEFMRDWLRRNGDRIREGLRRTGLAE